MKTPTEVSNISKQVSLNLLSEKSIAEIIKICGGKWDNTPYGNPAKKDFQEEVKLVCCINEGVTMEEWKQKYSNRSISAGAQGFHTTIYHMIKWIEGTKKCPLLVL